MGKSSGNFGRYLPRNTGFERWIAAHFLVLNFLEHFEYVGSRVSHHLIRITDLNIKDELTILLTCNEFDRKLMKNRLSISVVIPNHNRKEDILSALASAHNQSFNNFEVIVVDDNSYDNSVQAIKEQFPQVRVITLSENKGPAIARNLGIRQAHGDIIVGIDSDVVFRDRYTLQRVYAKFHDDRNVNCLAFRILNYYEEKDDIRTWWHPLPIETHANREFYTDYFSGSGYAFRKVVFEKAGYYPEDLYMHGEEFELALKILNTGFDIYYCPFITVLHKASEKSRNTLIPFYYHRRNQIWIVAKYYPFLKGMSFIIPRLAKTFFEALLQGHLPAFCRAMYDGMRGLRPILQHRQPLSKNTWRRINLIRRGKYHHPLGNYELY